MFKLVLEMVYNFFENIFFLVLDGDVDFKLEVVMLLFDLMRKNIDVGVVCGRIYFIGLGICLMCMMILVYMIYKF